MIIWIASYPKSGNTWLRSLISSYYFSKDKFNLSDLKTIPNFSVNDFINDNLIIQNGVDVAKQWLNVQRWINKNLDWSSTEDFLSTLSAKRRRNVRNFRFRTISYSRRKYNGRRNRRKNHTRITKLSIISYSKWS